MTPTIPRNSCWIDHGKFCFTQFIICCTMLIPIRLQDLHFFPRFPPGAFRSHAASEDMDHILGIGHEEVWKLILHPPKIALLKYFEVGLKKESFKWIWGCIQMDHVHRPRHQTKENGCKTIHMPRPIIPHMPVAKSQKTGSRRGWMREDLHQTLLMAAGVYIVLYMPLATEYDNFDCGEQHVHYDNNSTVSIIMIMVMK